MGGFRSDYWQPLLDQRGQPIFLVMHLALSV